MHLDRGTEFTTVSAEHLAAIHFKSRHCLKLGKRWKQEADGLRIPLEEGGELRNERLGEIDSKVLWGLREEFHIWLVELGLRRPPRDL